jgi:hypothetical protein
MAASSLERGIAAGERWERALHTAVNSCAAVIFLVSGNWLASGWCLKEYMLARALNTKLFGVGRSRPVDRNVPSKRWSQGITGRHRVSGCRTRLRTTRTMAPAPPGCLRERGTGWPELLMRVEISPLPHL